jgi:hypothetical protein
MEQLADDLDRLGELADAMLELISEGVELRPVPAASEPQGQPPAADRVQCRGHLRRQSRVPEWHAQDERADLHAFRDRCHGRERRPRLMHPLVAPQRAVTEHEMVGTPDGIEPAGLSGQRQVADRRPSILTALQRGVADRQHQTDLHGDGQPTCRGETMTLRVRGKHVIESSDPGRLTARVGITLVRRAVRRPAPRG